MSAMNQPGAAILTALTEALIDAEELAHAARHVGEIDNLKEAPPLPGDQSGPADHTLRAPAASAGKASHPELVQLLP
jgi:hypothetical protein